MKNIFLGIFFVTIVLIVFSVAIVKYLQGSSEIAKLKGDVTDHIPLSVDVDTLSAEELRLYQYAAAHTLDPIAALAGTDTEILRTAVQELAKSSKSISALYTEQIPSEALFPTALLLQLADLEDLRKKILEKPTKEVADQYHEELLEFLVAHQQRLDEVRTAVELHKGGAHLWKGITGTVELTEKLAMVINDLSSLQEKERERYECVTKETVCALLEILPAKVESVMQKKYSNQPIPEDVLFYQNFFTTYFKEIHNPALALGDAQLQDPPLVLLTDSFCAIHEEKPTYAILHEPTAAFRKIPKVELVLLEDMYFSQLSPEETLFGQTLGKNPVQYVLKNSDYYTCIDSGYDIQRALSIEYVRRELVEKPLETEDALFSEILTLQTSISSSSAVVDSEVEHFISLLDLLLSNHGLRFFEKTFDEEEARRLVQIIHTWNSQSAWFNYTVGSTEWLMLPILYIDEEGNQKIPFSVFFAIRSNFVSLYQLANRTILPEPRSFLGLSNADMEGQPIFPDNYENVLSYKESLAEQFPTIETLLPMVLKGRSYAFELLGPNAVH